jgi:hypothetical protein
MDDASVLLYITRFPLALLPASDESSMNSEGAASYFDIFFRQWEPKSLRE